MTDSTVAGNAADLEEAFPLVDPGAIPLGARVLVPQYQFMGVE